MHKRLLFFLLLFSIISSSSIAQSSAKDLIFIVDELRTQWDMEAEKMESYIGMKEYCHSKQYRKAVVKLLDQIHHYDTSLYLAVTAKYKDTNDPEVKETLDDIYIIETKYTNTNFKGFLEYECKKVIHIEKNMAKKDSGGFDEDIQALEEELIYYIDAITERVDLVDEHIHHLKGFDPEAVTETEENNADEDF